MKVYRRNLGLLALGSFIFFSCLVLFDLKVFNVWPQIKDIFYNYVSTPKSFISFLTSGTTHPHHLRFSLIFQIIYLSDILGLSIDYVFASACITSTFCFKVWFIRKVSLDNKLFIISVLYFVLIDFIIFKMNGRFLPAVVILPCHFIQLISNKRVEWFSELSFMSIFLIMSAVSSGTFTIVFTTYFCSKAIRFVKTSELNQEPFVAPFIILILFSKIQYILLEKNILYFSGNFTRLLNHGVGRFIPLPDNELSVMAMGVIALVIVIPTVYFLLSRFSYLVLQIISILGVSSILSLFGTGTMFVSIISILGAGIILFSNRGAQFSLQSIRLS